MISPPFRHTRRVDRVNWEAMALTNTADWVGERESSPGQPAVEPGQPVPRDDTWSHALGEVRRAIVATPAPGAVPARWDVRLASPHQLLSPLPTGAALAPACPLENLGDASFRADHGLRFA